MGHEESSREGLSPCAHVAFVEAPVTGRQTTQLAKPRNHFLGVGGQRFGNVLRRLGAKDSGKEREQPARKEPQGERKMARASSANPPELKQGYRLPESRFRIGAGNHSSATSRIIADWREHSADAASGDQPACDQGLAMDKQAARSDLDSC